VIIVHYGCDRFGGLAFKRGAKSGQVLVAVDAAELFAGLDHAGGAQAQRHLPIVPAFDSAGVGCRQHLEGACDGSNTKGTPARSAQYPHFQFARYTLTMFSPR